MIDWTAVIVGTVAAVPPTVASVLTYHRTRANTTAVREVSKVVNGQVSELRQTAAELVAAKDATIERLAQIPPP